MSKYQLPPRKYFDLEDASKKLTKDLGYEVTEKDIIYYANEGLIELSVYIDLEINIDEDEDYKWGRIEIRGVNLDFDELYKADFHCFSKFPQPYIKGKLFEAYVNDRFNYQETFDEMRKQSEFSEDGLIDMETFFTEQTYKYLEHYEDFELRKNNDEDDYCFIDIQTNIRKLKGFFSIDFEDFNNILLNNTNPIINTDQISFRPARSDNIQNGFGFYLIGYNWYDKSLFEITKKSIFVTYEELELLKQGKRKIRSIKTFEDMIEEIKYNSRVTYPDFIKKKKFLVREEQLEMFTLEKVPFQVANDEIFSETTAAETGNEKNKGGRPEHPLKQEAIEIAKRVYNAYNQDITRATLSEELALYLNKKYEERIRKRIFSTIAEETIKNYLTENGIGNRKGKSKNLDFEKVLKQS